MTGGSKAEPVPSLAEQLLAAADDLPDVREVLHLWGKPEAIGWIDLYKVFEIIRASVGGGPALIATGWTTKPEASRFTLSANHQQSAAPKPVMLAWARSLPNIR